MVHDSCSTESAEAHQIKSGNGRNRVQDDVSNRNSGNPYPSKDERTVQTTSSLGQRKTRAAA